MSKDCLANPDLYYGCNFASGPRQSSEQLRCQRPNSECNHRRAYLSGTLFFFPPNQRNISYFRGPHLQIVTKKIASHYCKFRNHKNGISPSRKINPQRKKKFNYRFKNRARRLRRHMGRHMLAIIERLGTTRIVSSKKKRTHGIKMAGP